MRRTLKEMLLKSVLLIAVNISFVIVRGQTDVLSRTDLNPVSPTAFQFLKYDQLPVSEYTGIPSISVPLYKIEEDGVSIPLDLTYHSTGVKVNQDASWVGLGWDLKVGSVIQIINDRDDYGSIMIGNMNSGPIKKILPDYGSSGPPPQQYPMRYKYPWLIATSDWSDPYPIQPPQEDYGYKIATDFYVPVNGEFNTRREGLFISRDYDSEPDIFIADFPGHSIKFIRQYDPDRLVVLNKKGYAVSKINDTWKIISPAGDEYYFGEKSGIITSSYSEDIQGFGESQDTSSIIWMLTKIVTKNKKEITFNYTKTNKALSYPNYSQKLQLAFNYSQTEITQTLPYCPDYCGLKGFPRTESFFPGTRNSYSNSYEEYRYLNSITFPKGEINFFVSNRDDIDSGKKLDKIEIMSPAFVRSYQFNYSYFDTNNLNENGFHAYNNTTDMNAALRLKLLSMQDNTGATHWFTYNSTPLPKKNSYAQDFWGFYNGQSSNTSLIPNPTTLKLPELGNNGNNRGANFAYTKAGILEQVQYPTGGKVKFDYELNQFDNYWVPDFSNNNNTISTGNGLRIKSITYLGANNEQLKKTIYSYSGGKAILPINMNREFSYAEIEVKAKNPTDVVKHDYTIKELSAMGAYTPNPLSSISGVGYEKVVKQEIDKNDLLNGKTETFFWNNPDILTTRGSSILHHSLPVIKQTGYPENGSVKTILYYDQQNKLIKKIENEYINKKSPLYYGARIFPYYNVYFGNTDGVDWRSQNAIGCYPIVDFETLLRSNRVINYVGNDSLVVTVTNNYDEYNRINSTIKANSDSNVLISEYLYPVYQSKLYLNNRLSEITRVNNYLKQGFDQKRISGYYKNFIEIGDKILQSKETVIGEQIYYPFPQDILISETFFDKYDDDGNLLQYTHKGTSSSFIWDYKNNYSIARCTNAIYTDIAATSFEADGKGNFNFSGIPVVDATAPTGSKVYPLSLQNTISTNISGKTKTFVVTYWSKSGPQNVNFTNAVAGQTINGWTHFRHEVINPIDPITISGNGLIDELRLYPKEAQMTTYTYEPLIGITSQCDANNQINYYEYDGFGRLNYIRDQDKNIIKKICYNYAGQPEDCSSIHYYSVQKSQEFTKNNCMPGYIGSKVIYTVPANTYNSIISQADADAKAQNDIDANGQNYANANGSCVLSCSKCIGVDKKCINNVCETGEKK